MDAKFLTALFKHMVELAAMFISCRNNVTRGITGRSGQIDVTDTTSKRVKYAE